MATKTPCMLCPVATAPSERGPLRTAASVSVWRPGWSPVGRASSPPKGSVPAVPAGPGTNHKAM